MTLLAAAIQGLEIAMPSSTTPIVEDISLELVRGEIVALVGESGSGKSTVATALLGFQRGGAWVANGRVEVAGTSILDAKPETLRMLRGNKVAYVPQDPATSLNPALSIRTQMKEVFEEHRNSSLVDHDGRIAQLLEEVALPSTADFLDRYPHQLSGGQQQRLLLAMAFANSPEVIVLDEPTTGLDMSSQSRVLAALRRLTQGHRTAALYVTHDLAVVATIADRTAVMYAGRIVEYGATRQLFLNASHPYTRRLLDATPSLHDEKVIRGIPGTAPRPGNRTSGCSFRPRCDVAISRCAMEAPPLSPLDDGHAARCWRAHERPAGTYPAAGPSVQPDRPRTATEYGGITLADVRASYGPYQVLHGINFSIPAGKCLALVGESGSGKTTLARCIAGLPGPLLQGKISLDNQALDTYARRRSKNHRKDIQYIFQNPYGSLHPRKQIKEILKQPVDTLLTLDERETERRMWATMELVRLDSSVLNWYPKQLSGGERQRVAIARALVVQPKFLICDEITTALDVSVQASIIELLVELQREMDLGILFVTHNLPLIRGFADRVAVLKSGAIVDFGDVETVLREPEHEYTRQLLRDTPVVSDALLS